MDPPPAPSWADGLIKHGDNYEGIVNNVSAVLELHKQDTVSTFGIRRSERPRSAPGKKDMDTEHVRALIRVSQGVVTSG